PLHDPGARRRRCAGTSASHQPRDLGARLRRGSRADLNGRSARHRRVSFEKRRRETWRSRRARVNGSFRTDAGVMPTLAPVLLGLFVQTGFTLLTCGLVRKKNAGHLVMLTFSAYVFGLAAYYTAGYAIQSGGHGFFMSGIALKPRV